MRVALVLALAVLAGCTSTSSLAGDVKWKGENARVSEGWAYDGIGVRLAEGTVEIDVNDFSNKGLVTATVYDGLTTWRVDWTDFAESRPFHDGGITRDLVEHGGTGTGDALIPEVHLLAAGWGQAKLFQNGKLVQDPATGTETLAAHFMVIDGALRDDEGRIHNASKAEPYDPTDPDDGHVEAGARQIFIQLKSEDPQSLFLVFEFRDATEGRAA